MSIRILVANPGSTSTKIAVYEAAEQKADSGLLLEVFAETLRHDANELQGMGSITDQLGFRKQVVMDSLDKNGFRLGEFAAIACRGGLVRQLPSGTYRVNDALIQDSRIGVSGQHASNLGALIGSELERESGVPAYIVDPPVVNELSGLARYSGNPLIERTCVWHALNQKAVARRYAHSVGKAYEDMNLLVCHMGGGVSVGAHVKGQVLDTEDAVSGEGPFSPERAGSLPASDLIRLCFSGKYNEKQLLKRIAGKAGLNAHLGTNNVKEIVQRIEDYGDTHAELILNAMIYHVAKNIAAEAAVLCGNIDAILLTGGLARSEYIVSRLRQRIAFLAPIRCFPGEDEMEALALNALDVLKGKRKAKLYD